MSRLLKLVMAALAAFLLPFVFAYQQNKVDKKDAVIDSLKKENIRLTLLRDPRDLVQRNELLEEMNKFLFQQKLVPSNQISIPDKISFTQEVNSPPLGSKGLTINLPDTIKQLRIKLQNETNEKILLRKQVAKLDSTLVVFSEESSSVAIKLVELCAIVKYDSDRNDRSWSRNEIDRLLNFLNNLCGATENWRIKTQQSKLRLLRSVK